MAGFTRHLSAPFLSGFVIVVAYFFVQLKTPLLSSFKVNEGVLVKSEIVFDKQSDKKVLRLWLNDTIAAPYLNFYRESQKKITPWLSFMQDSKIKIWYNQNLEIQQIHFGTHTILDYSWFLFSLTILLGFGVFLHLYAYKGARQSCVNIHSYYEMWDYTIGGRELIMKDNYRKYNPDKVLNLSWFDNLFISAKTKSKRIEQKITAWHQFFNICNAHAMTPSVREWIAQYTNGIEFLEGYDFYEKLIKRDILSNKLDETYDTIFEFMSIRLDEGREQYEDLGKLFREKFPREYFKIIKELNKLR